MFFKGSASLNDPKKENFFFFFGGRENIPFKKKKKPLYIFPLEVGHPTCLFIVSISYRNSEQGFLQDEVD